MVACLVREVPSGAVGLVHSEDKICNACSVADSVLYEYDTLNYLFIESQMKLYLFLIIVMFCAFVRPSRGSGS